MSAIIPKKGSQIYIGISYFNLDQINQPTLYTFLLLLTVIINSSIKCCQMIQSPFYFSFFKTLNNCFYKSNKMSLSRSVSFLVIYISTSVIFPFHFAMYFKKNSVLLLLQILYALIFLHQSKNYFISLSFKSSKTFHFFHISKLSFRCYLFIESSLLRSKLLFFFDIFFKILLKYFKCHSVSVILQIPKPIKDKI